MGGSNSVKANRKTGTKRREKANLKSYENANENQSDMAFLIPAEGPIERKTKSQPKNSGFKMGFLFP